MLLCVQAELADWLTRNQRRMSHLEDRLGDILSRISAETQEIKELEQQLTDSKEPEDQLETRVVWCRRFNPSHLLLLLLQVRSQPMRHFRGILRESSVVFGTL